MSKWVSLEEVKHHLRYDDDVDDPILSTYLMGAESAVSNYITANISNNDEDAINAIKVAVLILVGYYDLNRNPNKDTVNNGNYLPDPVSAILWPYRKPTAI